MKNLYLVAVVLFCFCNIFPQTWQVESVKPAAVDLYAVVALSSTNVLAFGGLGTELISTDAGETWQVHPTGTTSIIYSAFFLSDNQTGWIAGDVGTIMKTTDAGNTWVAQTSNTSYQLASIQFTSDGVYGVAVGASGVCVNTTNGGANWVVQTSPTAGSAISTVCIVPTAPPTVYIGSSYASGRLMKSTDYGVTFTNATPSGITSLGIYSMCYSDAQHYWIGGTSSIGIWYTTNGGTNWSASTGGTYQIYGLTYASTTPIAVDGGGLYWSTTNLGTSWTKAQLQTSKALRAVTFNGTNYIAVGLADAIIKSTNSGATWVPKTGGLDQGFIRNVVFLNDIVGLAGTQGTTINYPNGGNLWETTNGGNTWSVLYAFGTARQVYTIAVTTANTWYIGLDGNFIYKTTNAGATFTQLTTPLSGQTYWSSAFSDSLTGYYGTSTGNLIKTTDGGNTWTNLTTAAGFTSTIWNIYIKNATELYVSGGPSRIVKSTDGGATFSVINPGFSAQTYFCKFKDENVGFVAGLNYISRTTDNGSTWTATAATGSVYWVAFNGSTVWYLTGSGYLGTSTDNGATWTASLLNTNGLWCMAQSNNNLWVSASEGTMLKGTTASYTLNLNLSALLEAMYVAGGTAMTMSPSVTVELHNATSPYALVESQTATLSTAGVGTFNFTTAGNGVPYYMVVKYLNTVETWSANPVSFMNNLLTYDFTTGLGQAFTDGSNPPLALHGGKYCIYSGDVNQDGQVTSDDFTGVDNDNANFDYHVANDVNGDGQVTSDDFTWIDNNNTNFVSRQVPPGAPSHLVNRVKGHVQLKSSVSK